MESGGILDDGILFFGGAKSEAFSKWEIIIKFFQISKYMNYLKVYLDKDLFFYLCII